MKKSWETLGESLGCVPWRHVGLHHHPLYQQWTGKRRLSAAVQPACKTEDTHTVQDCSSGRLNQSQLHELLGEKANQRRKGQTMQNSAEVHAKATTAWVVYKKLEILDNSKGESGEWDWSGIYRSVNSKSLYFLKQDDKYQDDKNVFILLIFKQYLHLYTVYFFGDTHI